MLSSSSEEVRDLQASFRSASGVISPTTSLPIAQMVAQAVLGSLADDLGPVHRADFSSLGC